MSQTVSIQQAAEHLTELLGALGPDDEIVLTQNDRPVAKTIPSRPSGKRHVGSCKGMLVVHEDDEEHLKDFKDYMP
jgi:antitoxin (DNA-binding transcriptional repressor) of toxin-antitoxin stability system